MASIVAASQSPVYPVTWEEFNLQCGRLGERLGAFSRAYGVPTGGSFVAMALKDAGFIMLEAPEPGCIVVDDLVDSGETLQGYADQGYATAALYRKPHSPRDLAAGAMLVDAWIQFPWEHETAPESAVLRLLEYIGEDPTRDGLLDTPSRVCRAMAEMTSGYKEDPKEILSRTFDVDCDEMVVLRGIRFTSLCEHHMLPFTGVADVAYIPGAKVVGVSKLARVVQCFARRLQVQERMTQQIATAINEALAPQGVAVIIRAHHQCMGSRGVRQPDAEMVTSAMLGIMRDDDKARAEAMKLCR